MEGWVQPAGLLCATCDLSPGDWQEFENLTTAHEGELSCPCWEYELIPFRGERFDRIWCSQSHVDGPSDPARTLLTAL